MSIVVPTAFVDLVAVEIRVYDEWWEIKRISISEY